MFFNDFGVQNNLDRSFFGVDRLEGVDEEEVTLLLDGVPRQTLLSAVANDFQAFLLLEAG